MVTVVQEMHLRNSGAVRTPSPGKDLATVVFTLAHAVPVSFGVVILK